MARISVMPRVRCDRCKCVFPEDVHHGRMLMDEGFGDLSPGHGRTSGVFDLCDACARKVRQFVERPPEIVGDSFDE